MIPIFLTGPAIFLLLLKFFTSFSRNFCRKQVYKKGVNKKINRETGKLVIFTLTFFSSLFLSIISFRTGHVPRKWMFKNNPIKLIEYKHHFLSSAYKHEIVWVKTEKSKLRESRKEKILGVIIDGGL